MLKGYSFLIHTVLDNQWPVLGCYYCVHIGSTSTSLFLYWCPCFSYFDRKDVFMVQWANTRFKLAMDIWIIMWEHICPHHFDSVIQSCEVCNSVYNSIFQKVTSEAPTSQNYITLHLRDAKFMWREGLLRLQVKTLTSITSSKGCLYTRTGDWYFCTMVGITVTPTTWTKMRRHQSE